MCWQDPSFPAPDVQPTHRLMLPSRLLPFVEMDTLEPNVINHLMVHLSSHFQHYNHYNPSDHYLLLRDTKLTQTSGFPNISNLILKQFPFLCIGKNKILHNGTIEKLISLEKVISVVELLSSNCVKQYFALFQTFMFSVFPY